MINDDLVGGWANWMESHKNPWFQTTNQTGFQPSFWCISQPQYVELSGDILQKSPLKSSAIWGRFLESKAWFIMIPARSHFNLPRLGGYIPSGKQT